MKEEVFMESSNQDIRPTITSNNLEHDKSYYVNIDGEDIEVDVKNDSEYSCLLNCLEGYYIYGNGCDEDNSSEDGF